jgi:DNA-binding NarL/FixJ family response regulator
MNSIDSSDNVNQEAKVPIVLVDDHDIWRDGVRSMLASTEFFVIGESSSGKEAIGVVEACKPRIVLLDIRMAGGDGFEALKQIKSRFPQVLVLMLTTYSSPTFVSRAIADGASGYLTKGLKRSELVEALRTVTSGETLLSPKVMESSLQYVEESERESTLRGHPLEASEIELLRLLVAGSSNRDISNSLSVTVDAAYGLVQQIVDKLGVSDRVQAAVWAIKQGMV